MEDETFTDLYQENENLSVHFHIFSLHCAVPCFCSGPMGSTSPSPLFCCASSSPPCSLSCSETWPSVSTAEHYKRQESKCSICGDKKERCHVICHLFISFCEIFNLTSVLTSVQQADRRKEILLLLSCHLSLALQQCLTDLMCDCCFSIVCRKLLSFPKSPMFVSVGNHQHATVECSAFDCSER